MEKYQKQFNEFTISEKEQQRYCFSLHHVILIPYFMVLTIQRAKVNINNKLHLRRYLGVVVAELSIASHLILPCT